MLKREITFIFRFLRREKWLTAINVSGLAVGLACFFIIALYIRDEFNYDRFHTQYQRIFRVIGILDLNGQGEQSSSCPFPVGPALKNDYPDLIAHAVRFFNFQDPQHTLRVGENKFNENRIFLADSNVFKVFDFPLVKGNPDKVLAEPNNIVLTDALARKYFGDQNPIGQLIKFDGAVDLKVTGILADIPPQSHIHFDALISFSTTRAFMPNQLKNWVWNPNWTYVMLKPGVIPDELAKQFPSFVQKYYPDFLKPQVTHLLQPLNQIHLHSRYEYEIEPNGDIQSVYIFGVIGLFILLIAGINYINLATAHATNRAKEVGVRKASGASTLQLIRQFLLESVIIALAAAFIAILISALALPFINSFSGKELSVIKNMDMVVLLILAGCVLGLLAGFYPAMVLSSFQPARVLKSGVSSSTRSTMFRKMLVVLQFSMSGILIIGTGMVFFQLRFLSNKTLGFNQDQFIMLPVRPPMGKIFDSFIEQLKSEPEITGVTRMNDVIGKHHNTHEYNMEGMQPGKWVYYPSLLVDEEFVPAMNMQMLAGRNFSKNFKTDDSLGVIVNEAMVKHMGWENPENALGKQMFTPSGHERVIGVVRNFHYEPLHKSLGPFVLDMPAPKHKIYWTRYIGVRLKSGRFSDAIGKIEKIWEAHTSEYPFEYFFLRDDLDKQYKAQLSLGSIVAVFSFIAVLIACLGLFALASFSALKRKKEIGIRKVMGAGVSQVTHLLIADFLKLVILSNLISWPLSWYLINRWLNTFAFRVDFNWWLPVVSLVISVILALLTIGYHSLKAALDNPVHSLRYE